MYGYDHNAHQQQAFDAHIPLKKYYEDHIHQYYRRRVKDAHVHGGDCDYGEAGEGYDVGEHGVVSGHDLKKVPAHAV